MDAIERMVPTVRISREVPIQMLTAVQDTVTTTIVIRLRRKPTDGQRQPSLRAAS